MKTYKKLVIIMLISILTLSYSQLSYAQDNVFNRDNTIVAPIGHLKTLVYFLPQMKDQVLAKQHEMITNAKTSIDVAMFGMTVAKNNPYVQDLVNACKRGIKVRVYRDQGQSTQKLSALANDFIIKAGGKDKHCQVKVKSVRMPIQHSKYTVVDNQQVLWGSVNESASGMLQDNVEEYNELGVIFESNFEDIWKTGIDWSVWKNKNKENHK